LRIADFVAGEQQRQPLGEPQASQLVAAQLAVQRWILDHPVGPLMAAIVAVVVVGAVAIVFAVRQMCFSL
jgi:hypothetical protein